MFVTKLKGTIRQENWREESFGFAAAKTINFNPEKSDYCPQQLKVTISLTVGLLNKIKENIFRAKSVSMDVRF